MLNMSFYRNTLNPDVAKDYIAKSDKPCKYTFGLLYRDPTTKRVPISKERAFEIIDSQSFLDIEEFEDYIHLNAYSSNDMW